jgi:hypothetical protein
VGAARPLVHTQPTAPTRHRSSPTLGKPPLPQWGETTWGRTRTASSGMGCVHQSGEDPSRRDRHNGAGAPSPGCPVLVPSAPAGTREGTRPAPISCARKPVWDAAATISHEVTELPAPLVVRVVDDDHDIGYAVEAIASDAALDTGERPEERAHRAPVVLPKEVVVPCSVTPSRVCLRSVHPACSRESPTSPRERTIGKPSSAIGCHGAVGRDPDRCGVAHRRRAPHPAVTEHRQTDEQWTLGTPAPVPLLSYCSARNRTSPDRIRLPRLVARQPSIEG